MATDAAPSRAAGLDPSASLVEAERRQRISADHHRILDEQADERVFETRRFAEATRVAVRRINARFALELGTAESPVASSPAPLETRGPQNGAAASTASASVDAERSRRRALAELLGEREATAFETAERLTARTVAPRFRRQWAHDLSSFDSAPSAVTPTPAPVSP